MLNKQCTVSTGLTQKFDEKEICLFGIFIWSQEQRMIANVYQH
jgi:hypothetical protein